MAGLKQTTAKLARYRRQFESLLAANPKTARAPRGPGARTRTLREVTAFGSNPGNLRMLTYVPEGLPAGAPLVVVLHGCTQTAEGYDYGAGWSTLADRHGFAVLLPEQQRTNNPNVCFNWFQPEDTTRDRGEALSIRQMIERALDDYGLDRSLVFVTGLSAGGAMAAVMLATYPEVFAGGAIIAGLPYGVAGNVQEALDAMFQGKRRSAESWGGLVRAASPHNGPWPRVSIWHGSSDSTVRPVNADELVKQWTDVHNLPERPSFEDTVDGYPRQVWLDSSGAALVESYTITGMAHGTPIAAGTAEGETGTAGPFILETGISSSYRIARFWGVIASPAATAAGAKSPAPSPEIAAAPGRSGKPRSAASAAPGARPSVPSVRRPAASARPQPERAGLDPGAVITKALKKAGLIKG